MEYEVELNIELEDEEVDVEFGSVQLLKGDKGDKGDPGYTPVKGVDYFTESEIEEFKEEVTPVKGVDYFTESEIAEFKMEVTPVKGVDYFDGEKGDKGDSYEITEADYDAIADLTATKVVVPSKTSELINDSGFINSSYHDSTKQDTINDLSAIRSGAALGATALQSFTETDPTVPSWAKAATKPKYTASEVGALPSNTPLFSGDYNDLANKPSIPSKTSDLTNDSDFITSSDIPDVSDVVRYSVQTLTAEQKAQAKSNIDATRITSIVLTRNWTRETFNTYATQGRSDSWTVTAAQKASLVVGDIITLKATLTNAANLIGYMLIQVTSIPRDVSNVTGVTLFATTQNYVTIDDSTNDTSKTWSSEKIAQRFSEVEMAKFPNVTIIGQPTISNGQISGFTANNYCMFPFMVDFAGRPFEILFKITTGTDVSKQHNIIDSLYGLAIAVRSSKFVVAMSSTGTNWNLGESIGSHTVNTSTGYLIKFYWDGSAYKLDYSINNGESWINDITKASTATLAPKQILIGKSTDGGTIFNGIIDLNDCKLTISEKIVWQGMDDVGLATRMAIDMSNIDDAGKAKIKEIVGPIPTNVSDLTNDSGFITSDSLDGYDKVFIAEWNKTSVEDITRAINDHKDIRIEYQNRIFNYSYTGNDRHYFASYSGTTNAYYITVNITSGAWAYTSTSLQSNISDLDTIRSGASLGATALQSETDPLYTADKPNLALKSDIPANGYLIRVTYAVTSGDEIKAILDDGNTPYIVYNGNTYYYQDISYDNYYRFVSITPGSNVANDPPVVKRIYKSKTSAGNQGWGTGSIQLYSTTHKPTASDVGALPSTTKIPSKTSDLTNDSNFVTDASYVHTDNNFTTTLKNRINTLTDSYIKSLIEDGTEVSY